MSYCSRMENIETFMNLTSLDGWQYLNISKQSRWKRIYWTICILVSIICAILVLVQTITELINENVITFQDPKEHSLEEIYFPGLTICNVNQVRRSYFEELGIYGNETAINHIHSYYMGDHVSMDQANKNATREILIGLDEGSKENGDLKRNAHQNCKHMFISDRWMGEKQYTNRHGVSYETDWGVCCIYHPKLNKQTLVLQDNEKIINGDDWKNWKENISKVVMAGRKKGYELILDVEGFDYSGADVSYEGFQLVVGSFHEQAIVNQRAVQIAPGTENQIAITPSMSSITARALSRFDAAKRHCYTENEIGLSYFPQSKGYMYTMDNCIFESTLHKVFKKCKCYPYNLNFHNKIPCTEEGRVCMDEVYANLRMVGHIGHDHEKKECLPLCKEQFLSLFMTAAKYPNENLFIYKQEFCVITERLMEKCDGVRRKPLEEMYPGICSKLNALKSIDLAEACNDRQWPLTRATLPNCTWERCDVEDAITQYSRHNMVAINVFFPNPFVKQLIRDVRFTTLDFVGNLGGLLGLCMGFSVISLAEILFCFLTSVLTLLSPRKNKILITQ